MRKKVQRDNLSFNRVYSRPFYFFYLFSLINHATVSGHEGLNAALIKRKIYFRKVSSIFYNSPAVLANIFTTIFIFACPTSCTAYLAVFSRLEILWVITCFWWIHVLEKNYDRIEETLFFYCY